MAPIPSALPSSQELPGHTLLKPIHALNNAARHVKHPSPPPTCSSSTFARLLRKIPNLHDSSSNSSPSSLLSSIARRTSQMISIPSTYAGPYTHPGVVIGIVFATVLGIILLLYGIFFALGGARLIAPRPAPEDEPSDIVDTEESRSRGSRPRSRPVVQVQYDSSTSSEETESYMDSESLPQSPRRSHGRPGGYRPVDPHEYGGGRRPRRSMRG